MDNSDIKGRVLAIDALADYQSGSVVSRTIIKKETGTVTFFAFSKGEELSEHTAPFDAMVYVLDGKARVIIDGRPFDLDRGQMIIMPANRPHSLKALEQFKMLLVLVK